MISCFCASEMKCSVMYFFKIDHYVRKQALITLYVGVSFVLMGFGINWSGSVIPKLRDPDQTPLPYVMTEVEASWVGPIVHFGAFTAVFVAYLTNLVGRRKSLIIAGFMSLISYIILQIPKNIAMIYAGRLLVGTSLIFITIPGLIYIGEISSPNVRGIFLTSLSIFIALGGLIVNSVGPFISYTNLGYVALSINLLYILLSFQIPESPVYYVIKGNEEAAKATLRDLGRDRDIDTELKTMLENKEQLNDDHNKLKQLLTVKSNRKAFIISAMLLLFQQASGTIAIGFYSMTIFQSAGSSIRPEIGTVLIGVTSFVGNLVSPFVVEKQGRRILLILSTFGLSICMTMLGTYFFFLHLGHTSVESLGWLPLASLIGSVISFNLGLNGIPNTIVAEVYQPNLRGLGSSISLYIGWMAGMTSNIAFGYVVAAVGSHVIFWMFGAINAIAFIFVITVVPETKGKSLTEIETMLSK